MTSLFMLVYSEEEDRVEDIGATCVFHGVFTTKEAAQAQMRDICEAELASNLPQEDIEDERMIHEQYPVPETPQTEWGFDRGAFRIHEVTLDEQRRMLVLL